MLHSPEVSLLLLGLFDWGSWLSSVESVGVPVKSLFLVWWHFIFQFSVRAQLYGSKVLSNSEAISLEGCGFSPSACLPSLPCAPTSPVRRRNWSMRLLSWGLGRGWEDAVNGTPVKGSFGGLHQVASLFWYSSRVLLSTDTPLGSSMGRSMTSWVMGSRNSSGTGRLEGERHQIICIDNNI